MSEPILELKGITKRFGSVAALDEVSLSVCPGEIVALIGENGAGKSTLMKIVGGVLAPDHGLIRINGQALTLRSASDAARHGIGFIHQELNVLDNLDVAANIFLGREPTRGLLRFIDSEAIHTGARAHLRRLGVDLATDTLVRELPIAHRQLVEIAKALALQTRVLLLDEPTSSLTLAETQRLLSVLRDLRAEGVGMVYISHRLSEVQQIANRVVALRDGRNAGELAREDIEHDRMVRLMVGRDIQFRRPEPMSGGARRLVVRDLRTSAYPDQAVSFEIAAGEIVGFAGLIGAGRSEIARALFGVDRTLAGSIALNGEAVDIRSPRDAIRRGIYLVPEDRRRSGCIVSMSVRENLTLPRLADFRRNGLLNGAAERAAAHGLQTQYGIKCAHVEQTLGSLSGGNQQKTVIAKWLSRAPRLLIFDEPTRGVDVGAKAEIYRLIRQLGAAGTAIMLISSDMEEVIGESHRVIVMHEGAVAGSLERDDCSEEAIMRLAVGHRRAVLGVAGAGSAA